MPKFIKGLLTVVIVLIFVSLCLGAYKAYSGNIFANAPMVGIAMVIGLIFAGWVAVKGIKIIQTLAIAAISLMFISGCNYAKSNQKVLISEDCGMSWKEVSAGDAVPKGTMNRCFMKIVIPNFPMQGEASFVTNLAERVRVISHIDYDYSISNGLKFIREAKSLGTANADADSDAALNNEAFEGAENRVIDKRIRDVAKAMFLKEDIIELDQAELENKLSEQCNKILEPYGIVLNFITLTFDTDAQTRQAIDVATAMKIYKSKDLEELGKQVIIARAGANQITVESGDKKTEAK